MNEPRFIFDVCENDEYGRRSGHAAEFGIYLSTNTDMDLEFDYKFLGDFDFDYIDEDVSQFIEVKYGKYQVLSMREWVGNKLWNEYELSLQEGLRLINDLIKSNDWQLSQGESSLFEKASKGPLTLEDFGLDSHIYFPDPNQLSLF